MSLSRHLPSSLPSAWSRRRLVLREARHLVRVARQPVVVGVAQRQVPLEALGGERVAPDHRARQRHVGIAASEERAVAEHPEVDVHGSHDPHDGLVVVRAVVEIGERGQDQERRPVRPRRGELRPDAKVVADDPVRVREGARADGGVILRGGRGRGTHRGVDEVGALRHERLQVGPGVGVGLQRVDAARVPHQGHDELRRLRVGSLRRRDDGLAHRALVHGLEPEVQQRGLRGGDAGQGDRPLHGPLRLDVARAVPEHGHVLDVVPRPHVRQTAAHEVGLARDVGELAGAIRPVAAPGPQQPLMRQGAREVDEVLVRLPRARAGYRPERQCAGDDEQDDRDGRAAAQ